MNMLKKINSQRGAVLVLVACGITAFIGMAALVIDAGQLFLHRAQLINLVDAAALAGVQDLPNRSKAQGSAEIYARKNDNSDSMVMVNFDPLNTKITVNATRNVALTFAQVLGIKTATVEASATAQRGSIAAVGSGLVPFGIQWNNFVYGQRYTLKLGPFSESMGNFNGLQLGPKPGARTYEDNIHDGYNGRIAVGDVILTETGNMDQPTTRAVNYRVDQRPTETYLTVTKDSPRLVVVPIITPAANGKSEVTILGFAVFFLEKIEKTKDVHVSGRFMRMFIENGEMGNDNTPDYGAYTVKLIN